MKQTLFSLLTILLFVSALVAAPALPAFEWKTAEPSPIPRLEEAAMVVNGKLYLFGGFTTASTSARVDAYDIAKDSWSQLKDMPSPVNHLNAAVDGNTAWFAGGFKGNNPGKATEEVWKYDIAADAWSAGPPLPEARGAGALAVAGRELHFFGGFKADRNTNCADHWVLSLDAPREWKRAADLPDARGHLSTAVLNGKIYAFGGQHGHDPKPVDVDSCHVFDTATGQWSSIAKLPIRRSHFESSTIVYEGRIIIVGGRSNSSTPSRSAVNNITEYDPATDLWRELGSIPQNLAAPAAVIFGGHIIVSCGGLNGTGHPQSTTIIAPLVLDSLKRNP